MRTVPTNYMLCIKSDCPKAATCLRYKATQMMPTEVKTWSILSPTFLEQMEGECPHYRSVEKVRYARGFVRMIRTLPVNISEMVAQKLIADPLDLFSLRAVDLCAMEISGHRFGKNALTVVEALEKAKIMAGAMHLKNSRGLLPPITRTAVE